ncbi:MULTISPECIES: YjfB family protein [unclassified Guyparkeria]|uniref:YjfB family protein n=1 Tax=unclassified Guyparkeria TaxID=2626246 RepID=UPI000733678B|nr:MULTISPECIES: YjfB family protein [unclassified Guyparkeria]KTG16038.1 hypothetical protein AUR63_04115 [Guyparkeria sp. XI15]OAE84889.1 hypothetical protein AWR35_04125 [Guyparkeria sp. WRN-7]
MADPVAAGGIQAAMPNVQLAQEVGVRVQKEAMETQEKAMAPLIESIDQGGEADTPSSDGPVGGQINTYA